MACWGEGETASDQDSDQDSDKEATKHVQIAYQEAVIRVCQETVNMFN